MPPIIAHDSFQRLCSTPGFVMEPVARDVMGRYPACDPIHCAGGAMKTPKRLMPLLEEGLIDEVLSQLMSGKEATVYVVRCGETRRCAKVYKEANKRSFRQAASYTEGRKVKNTRQARAMEKGTRYGRQVQEEQWQNAEVDALFRLA